MQGYSCISGFRNLVTLSPRGELPQTCMKDAYFTIHGLVAVSVDDDSDTDSIAKAIEEIIRHAIGKVQAREVSESIWVARQ